MKFKQSTLALAVILTQSSLGLASTLNMQAGNKIIYGTDDRYEASSYPSKKFRELSKSVAGMVRSSKLREILGDNDFYSFDKKLVSERAGLCEEERFKDQYSLLDCSGFLIAPDILVTAGHCVVDTFDCREFKWVFDFNNKTEKINKSNIYSCEKILDQDLYESRWKLQDFTVLKLNRPAQDRAPLKFRRKKRAKVGTELVIIGHPAGLPMKISDNAVIKRMNKNEIFKPLSTLIKKHDYFNANLDAYEGNSGSPVFNLKTKLVEGILVRGGEDYIRNIDYFCNESNRLSNSRWNTKEKVFRITKVPLIKKLQDEYFAQLKK